MNVELTVTEIMTPSPCVIGVRDHVGHALREMQAGSFRHLPVVDAENRVVGIVSQRDLLTAENGSVPVSRVMCADVKAVRPETAAHEAAYVLLRHKIGCVPVVDVDGVLVGIVTETDFLHVAYTALGGHVSVEELEMEQLDAGRS
jgi:CBS-domain-containing membrane protein